MRIVIGAAVLAAATTLGAATSAAIETTTDLREACAAEEIATRNLCYGFIQGAGQFYIELRRAEQIEPIACADPVPKMDESREAIVVWIDARYGSHIYGQRLDGSGTEQWTSGGMNLGGTSQGYWPRVVPDGSDLVDTKYMAVMESCNECHVDLVFHGRRFLVEYCTNCHTPQLAEGEGAMSYMTHRIHAAGDFQVLDGGISYAEVTYPQDLLNCRKCHNDESPTFKGFDYAEYSAKIAHPIPEEHLATYK